MSASSQQHEVYIRSILTSIQKQDDSATLRSNVEKCSASTLLSWRDNSDYDLLHHAIFNNNVVAAGTFFSMGLFKTPHEPSVVPYLHLACHLGYRSLAMMFLQERPDDNKPKLFNFKDSLTNTKLHKTENDHPGSSCGKTLDNDEHTPGEEKDSKYCSEPREGDEELKMVTPLDVAAERNHLSCVKSILDFCQARRQLTGKTRPESYTDLACKLDSPSALRLLLTEQPEETELNQAVALALKLAKPECLDTLLRYKINRKDVFGGMNFFHVLFTYSYSFDKSWYESLVTMTSILLRHGHPVHAFRPSRTYPLYSLLSHTHFHDIERSAPFRIACLLLMLNSGADPNFDEVKIEELVRENEYETAFGRPAYPSALHCLFGTLGMDEADDNDKETMTKFMFKCVGILLKHEADVNYVGCLGDGRSGTSLHALADASCHIGIHRQTLLLLLRHGADPNVKTETFPICEFARVLLSNSDDTKSETAPPKLVDGKCLRPLLKGMTLDSLHQADNYIRKLQNEADFRLFDESKHDLFLSEIENFTKNVWTLKRMCMQATWILCRRNFQNVASLPLPLSIKTEILADSL